MCFSVHASVNESHTGTSLNSMSRDLKLPRTCSYKVMASMNKSEMLERYAKVLLHICGVTNFIKQSGFSRYWLLLIERILWYSLHSVAKKPLRVRKVVRLKIALVKTATRVLFCLWNPRDWLSTRYSVYLYVCTNNIVETITHYIDARLDYLNPKWGTKERRFGSITVIHGQKAGRNCSGVNVLKIFLVTCKVTLLPSTKTSVILRSDKNGLVLVIF